MAVMAKPPQPPSVRIAPEVVGVENRPAGDHPKITRKFSSLQRNEKNRCGSIQNTGALADLIETVDA